MNDTQLPARVRTGLKSISISAKQALKGLEDLYWVTQSDLNGMYDNNNEQLKDMLFAAKLAQTIAAMQAARELLYEADKMPQATSKRAS